MNIDIKNYDHHARAVVIRENQLLIMHRENYGRVYRTLIGGGIDEGETPEQAAVRETLEETQIAVTNPIRVFTEIVPDRKVVQHVFVCEYTSGEPELAIDSEEYESNKKGKNKYFPMWIDIDKLIAETDKIPFITPRLLEEVAKLRSIDESGAPIEWVG